MPSVVGLIAVDVIDLFTATRRAHEAMQISLFPALHHDHVPDFISMRPPVIAKTVRGVWVHPGPIHSISKQDSDGVRGDVGRPKRRGRAERQAMTAAR